MASMIKRALLARVSPVAVAQVSKITRREHNAALTRAAFHLEIATERSEQHYTRKHDRKLGR